MDAPLLQLRDVVVEYPRPFRNPVRAVAGVDLEVHPGQIVGLVGESGCGKSTLARAAIGLVDVKSGSVDFEGEPVAPLGRRPRPVSQRRLQMIFQDPYASLNPRRTVASQIIDGLALAAHVPRAHHKARVTALLDRVGLPATAANSYPHQFSGGQRQRIAIARALAAKPSMLIADEPVASLDASIQAQVANLLVDIVQDLGLGMVFISHDLGVVRSIAHELVVMYLGKIVERGPTDAVWAKPRHPYSEALIAALPRVDAGGLLPEAPIGEVPDPASPPSGCRFHPRCPYVHDRCSVEEPTLHSLGAGTGHNKACFIDASETEPTTEIGVDAASTDTGYAR